MPSGRWETCHQAGGRHAIRPVGDMPSGRWETCYQAGGRHAIRPVGDMPSGRWETCHQAGKNRTEGGGRSEVIFPQRERKI